MHFDVVQGTCQVGEVGIASLCMFCFLRQPKQPIKCKF